MTTNDVLELFAAAAKAINESGVEFETGTKAGLTMSLTDRLLQVRELEESTRRVTPVIAGPGSDRGLRSVN